MEKLKASSPLDVLVLVQWLVELDPVRRPAVLAHAHNERLMRARGTLRPMLWLVRRLRGKRGVEAFFDHLAVRDPRAMHAMWWQMLDHIHLGRDTEDADSSGGWSQQELDLFLAEPCRPF